MHLVMFDIDGTLTRTNEVDEICFVRAVEEVLSIREIDTDWRVYRHVTDAGILQEIVELRHARPPEAEEVRRVRERFCMLLEEAFDGRADLCAPVEGGVETLRRLAAEDDQAVALATGGWGPTARAKLARAGYPVEDLVLASSSDALARVDIMRTAEARAKTRYGAAAFETITYVGDGPWDCRAASGLGWRFVGVAAGERAELLRGMGARFVVSRYDEPDFIDLVRRVQAG